MGKLAVDHDSAKVVDAAGEIEICMRFEGDLAQEREIGEGGAAGGGIEVAGYGGGGRHRESAAGEDAGEIEGSVVADIDEATRIVGSTQRNFAIESADQPVILES